ncbi:MAG: CCA tRNA nucleotidyltransferase [Clostridia bacterium]|nr:CCA tRNA nucleotidyltransferase [Clostridia bacterium]
MMDLPPEIIEIIACLNDSGYKAYAVGGCVRDHLRGVLPHDYDVTTDALPETVARLFPHTVPTGIAHGTVTVVDDGMPVEVTTFRQEFGYSDRRRPDRVAFVADVKEDLARRDFTVNAMAYHPTEGLVDPFGGQKDLENGVLRAVGDSSLRFREDALRSLRLFRFAATLGFQPEEKTCAAALQSAPLLENISKERIAAELQKTVCGAFADAVTPLLQTGGLAFLGISSSAPLTRLTQLPPKKELRLFAFLYCCQSSVSVLKTLRYSNAIVDYAGKFDRLLKGEKIKSRTDIKRALRNFGQEILTDFFGFREVFFGESAQPLLRETEDILYKEEPYRLSQLAVNGKNLKSVGIRGEAVGQALDFLLEAVLEEPQKNTAPQLLALAEQFKRNQ